MLTDFRAKKVPLEAPRRTDTAAEDKVGIDVSRLAPGTRLLIETEAAMYDALVGEDCFVVIKAAFDQAFVWPMRLRVLGSLYNRGEIKPAWIGRGCRLRLKGQRDQYHIGPIFSVLIILPSGTEFSLWE